MLGNTSNIYKYKNAAIATKDHPKVTGNSKLHKDTYTLLHHPPQAVCFYLLSYHIIDYLLFADKKTHTSDAPLIRN